MIPALHLVCRLDKCQGVHVTDVVKHLATDHGTTPAVIRYENRWAIHGLKRANCIVPVCRATYKCTTLGVWVVNLSKPSDDFRSILKKAKIKLAGNPDPPHPNCTYNTPDGAEIPSDAAEQRFKQLVVFLMVEMGNSISRAKSENPASGRDYYVIEIEHPLGKEKCGLVIEQKTEATDALVSDVTRFMSEQSFRQAFLVSSTQTDFSQDQAKKMEESNISGISLNDLAKLLTKHGIAPE